MREHSSRFRDVAATKRAHDPALVDLIVGGCFEGDPAADALVAHFRTLPGGAGWRALSSALAAGGDSEIPELRALLAPLYAPPAWVDLDLADAGALALWRNGGSMIGLTHTFGSLAFGYQSAGLVRPLAATGRLEQMAPRRVGETARWYAAATPPGRMRPGAEGFEATIRLRLVHALVRAHLAAQASWDEEDLGVPISASDGFATALGGFLVVPMRAMRDLGVRFSADDREAMTHLWAWIGFVMGVPERLLPRTWAQARAMVDCALDLDAGPNEDSPRMMAALLQRGVPIDQVVPGPLKPVARAAMAQVWGSFTRRWLGDEMSDRLGVPDSRIVHLIPLLRLPVLARDSVRRTGLLGSDERIVAVEVAMVARMLNTGRAPAVIAPEEAEARPVLQAA